jgi:DNA polymerase-3 subunit beta
MRIEISCLKKALGVLTPFCAKKGALPITSCLLIRHEPERVVLTVTDLMNELSYSISGEFEPIAGFTDACGLAVDAAKLLAIVARLPADDAVVLKADDQRLLVRCVKTRARYALGVLSGQDFPLTDSCGADDQVMTITVESSSFLKALMTTLSAAGKDDARYYLNGVCFDVDKKKQSLTLVGTDGHRLNAWRLPAIAIDSEAESRQLIVARSSAQALKTIIEHNTAEQLVLYFASRSLRVSSAADESDTSIDAHFKLIDGRYPDYERVIPVNHAYNLSCNREAFIQALQRLAPMTEKRGMCGVKLELTSGAMNLRVAYESDEGEDSVPVVVTHALSNEVVDIDNEWTHSAIGLNLFYVLDMLKQVPTEDVVISFNDSTSPLLISHDDVRCVTMPMRL